METGSLDLQSFGKGCIPAPENIKAEHYRLAFGAPQVDWSKPYMVENGFKLKIRDQKTSSSCTAQATSYYCEALEQIDNKKSENYSARYIYSQSHLPGGGAYIYKAMSIPLKGVASADSVPDGDSTEQTMTDTSLNAQGVIEAKAKFYAQLANNHSIDELAGFVERYGGFIYG